jgi:hypothetical protein
LFQLPTRGIIDSLSTIKHQGLAIECRQKPSYAEQQPPKETVLAGIRRARGEQDSEELHQADGEYHPEPRGTEVATLFNI